MIGGMKAILWPMTFKKKCHLQLLFFIFGLDFMRRAKNLVLRPGYY